MSIHDGHRARVRQRFIDEGLDNFKDHEVLEMLLFYCVSRKDTNELAHRLLDEFGSLMGVMTASPAQLSSVFGVGDNIVLFLRFLNDLNRFLLFRKKENEFKTLKTLDDCGSYLYPKFFGCRNEVVYMLCLDSKCKLLGCKFLGEGSVNSAAVPIRRIVEYALNMNATTVVLAHNHPSGVALPSVDDVQTTRVLSSALLAVDVLLADHIIYSDDEFISMAQSNYFLGEDVFYSL